MKNKKQKKTMLLLLILLGVSVGFALLSTTLKINGTAGIKSNTWDIHWENVVPNQNSTVQAETPTIGDNATKVTYEVELSLPGDFYEFTVDAVNDGSVNGKIDDIRHTVKEVTIVNNEEVETTATLPNYILYSIYYDGTTTAPAEGDILEAGDTQTYKVRIEYDSLAEVLPDADKVYRITDEIDYVQTKDSNSIDINALMEEIEADPDSYRNPEQSVSNRDIGLDENGNVINLDWWVDKDNCVGEKIYYLNNENNGMILGKAMCGNDDTSFDAHYTAATSAANIENGEWKLTYPEYIYDDNTSKFYPVVEIAYIFGNFNYGWNNREPGKILTTMPKFPDTVTTIGTGTFQYIETFTSVTIPKNIRIIRTAAFANSYDPNGLNNTLIFENNSQLEDISICGPREPGCTGAFCYNNFKGNLVLPQTVKNIGKYAFRGNKLTSVTFPSSATYFDEYENSFDSNVTINHNY